MTHHHALSRRRWLVHIARIAAAEASAGWAGRYAFVQVFVLRRMDLGFCQNDNQNRVLRRPFR
jgi:hypothetical protein